MRLFLQKTDLEKREQNPKLPYFKLVIPPEEDGGEWKDVGAFWKAKSGNGYSGQLDDGLEITGFSEEKVNVEDTKNYDKLTETNED